MLYAEAQGLIYSRFFCSQEANDDLDAALLDDTVELSFKVSAAAAAAAARHYARLG